MEEYNSSLAPLFGTDDNNCFTMEDRTHAKDPTKGLDLAILVILASIGVLIGLGTMLEIYEVLFKRSPVAGKESSNFLPLELTKSFSLISNTSTLLSSARGEPSLKILMSGVGLPRQWIMKEATESLMNSEFLSLTTKTGWEDSSRCFFSAADRLCT